MSERTSPWWLYDHTLHNTPKYSGIETINFIDKVPNHKDGHFIMINTNIDS